MPPEGTRTLLLITGMKDNACRERVAGALERVRGVREVVVNLFRASASIHHEPSCAAGNLVRAVTEAGYGATLAGRAPPRGAARVPRLRSPRIQEHQP